MKKLFRITFYFLVIIGLIDFIVQVITYGQVKIIHIILRNITN